MVLKSARSWHPLSPMLVSAPNQAYLLPPVCFDELSEKFIGNYRKRIRASLLVVVLFSLVHLGFAIASGAPITDSFFPPLLVLALCVFVDEFWFLKRNSNLVDRARFYSLLYRRPSAKTSLAIALTVGCCVWSCQLLLEGLWAGRDALIMSLGATAKHVQGGEIWRLVSGIFVHGEWQHLLANLTLVAVIVPLAGWLFGAKAIGVFLAGGALGAIAQLAGSDGNTVIGASGGVFALFGATTAATFRLRTALPSGLWVQVLGLSVLTMSFAEALVPTAATAAHIAGGLVGAIAAAVMFRPA